MKILAKQLGSRRLAIGVVVEFWELAQEHWARDKSLIPKKQFELLKFPKFLLDPELGFAEELSDGIYAKGSEEFFSWILSRREAAQRGGIASGRSRNNKIKGLGAEPNPNDSNPPIPIPIPNPKETPLLGETFQVVAELSAVSAILEGRKIPEKLQRLWLESYTVEYIVEKIRALKAWELTAGPKGKKKNWGRFYSNCFSKDWDRWSKRLPSARQDPGMSPQLQEYINSRSKIEEEA